MKKQVRHGNDDCVMRGWADVERLSLDLFSVLKEGFEQSLTST